MTQPFGKYQLLKKLATGGMAEVWLARQTGIEGFNRHVVVKRILPHLAEDPEFIQMFLNEAKIAARFNHPNIGQIYDLGEENGQYFIAMEYIHGEDLGRIMRRAWSTGQWVGRSVSLRIIADACQALHYAHSRTDENGRPLKVVHRDISPQNILISFDGSVKIVDFGIAKAADQASNTRSGAIKGKFAYMPPEQAQGRPIDARADIFAIGLVLYELLTGVRPLKRDAEMATLQAALECKIDPPSVVADVPPEVDDVVMRALAKDVDDRYRDARQFHIAIEEYLVTCGMVATSVQVSQLMEQLFADRLEEEARTGALNPPTNSSVSNVASSEDLPPARDRQPPARERPGPSSTQSDEDEPGTEAASPALPPPSTRRRATPEREDTSTNALDAPPKRTSTSTAAAPAPNRRANPDGEYDDEPAKPRKSSPSVKRPSRTMDVPPPAAPASQRKSRNMPSVSRIDAVKPRGPQSLSVRKPTEDADVEDSRPTGDVQSTPSSTAPSTSQKFGDVTLMRQRQAQRTRVLIGALAMMGVLTMAIVFRTQLGNLLNSSVISRSGTPVLLTVTSNPRTHVTVVPPVSSKREPVDLGDTPLEAVSGAFAGDTVVLSNLDRGIRYEEVVEATQGHEPRLIEKSFKEATLKVNVLGVKGGEVYQGTMKLGTAGMAMKLFEGVHRLEIRSSALNEPYEFEVRLAPGEVKVETVDVTRTRK